MNSFIIRLILIKFSEKKKWLHRKKCEVDPTRYTKVGGQDTPAPPPSPVGDAPDHKEWLSSTPNTPEMHFIMKEVASVHGHE